MASNSAAALYDDLGLKYEEGWGHDQGLIDFIKSSIQLLPKEASILDIGSGTGKPTSQLVVESGRKLKGIDISPAMVDLSRKQVPGATFELVNMLDFKPESQFDAAFAIFSLFHLSPDEMTIAFQQFSEWIAPNGYLFIGTIEVEYSDTVSHVFEDNMQCSKVVERNFKGKRIGNRFYTREGWKKLLEKSGFEVVKSEMIPFQAPQDLERHYYITARKGSYLLLNE